MISKDSVVEAYMINDKRVIAEMLYDTITRYEERNCTNCEWYLNDVCVNREARLCADFVSDSDVCKLWEIR